MVPARVERATKSLGSLRFTSESTFTCQLLAKLGKEIARLALRMAQAGRLPSRW